MHMFFVLWSEIIAVFISDYTDTYVNFMHIIEFCVRSSQYACWIYLFAYYLVMPVQFSVCVCVFAQRGWLEI